MKDKKKIKQALEYVRRTQSWDCELISATVTRVTSEHEVMVLFYNQISTNPDVHPCPRFEVFVNGMHRSGGVIR